jgi:hypothetical protein
MQVKPHNSPGAEQARNSPYTPGPWIAKEQYRDSVTNDVGHFVMWQDRSKPGVMLRRLDDKKGAFSANDAKLIAAAPDLLDFTKEIRGYLDMKLTGFRQDYPENHCIVETAKRYLAQCDAILTKLA